MPGQKGLRILSFDGGGVRGLLSIAILSKIMEKLDGKQVYEVFDIICGTSTGAILAALFTLKRANLQQASKIYEMYLKKIFTRSKMASAKLMWSKVFYDDSTWEVILKSMCGTNTIMLDSIEATPDVKFFAVASQIHHNPAKIMLFRNYNYPRSLLTNEKISRYVIYLKLFYSAFCFYPSSFCFVR